MLGKLDSLTDEIYLVCLQAKLRSSSWWTRYFVQTGLTENEGPLKKFEEATSKNKYKPDCQIFHLSSPRWCASTAPWIVVTPVL